MSNSERNLETLPTGSLNYSIKELPGIRRKS